MTACIPVIDVFAGPGGLGEGFSALGRTEGKQYFKIGVSVEKEASAHSTLELRSFFRQFPYADVPPDYYSFLRGEITKEVLFSRHPKQSLAAKDETWLDALGRGADFDGKLDQRISSIIAGHDKWILIGGPPCQAYSVIGRSRNSGKENYRLEDDEKSILYLEYLRILAKHQPPVFVMENVKGLLSAKIHGRSMFEDVLSDLQNPAAVFSSYSNKSNFKYRIYSLVKRPQKHSGDLCTSHLPEDYIVRCEKYGIPQARHRVILLGIRDDFAAFLPNTLTTTEQINTEAVLNGLPELRSGLSKELDSQDTWRDKVAGIAEQQWVKTSADKYGQDFNDRLMSVLNSPFCTPNDRGSDIFVPCNPTVSENLKGWYLDSRMTGVCNHSTRGHIFDDIQRYLFASCFAQHNGTSARLQEYPSELLPNHKNATSGHFNDRFRVQAYGRPSSTITSHISKDGHYYIHPDPRQCRSLTVREAARLQTFPDNYFFCGNRTQQYVQVGNAVPPLLAYQIAEVVYNFLKRV
ncbi:MAG: DNA cytosine methyltransferase [Deltaproteobacteria bacterium]|nr:DNA cytosine methyltransferase [Deltaproteobacteria bacterium]